MRIAQADFQKVKYLSVPAVIAIIAVAALYLYAPATLTEPQAAMSLVNFVPPHSALRVNDLNALHPTGAGALPDVARHQLDTRQSTDRGKAEPPRGFVYFPDGYVNQAKEGSGIIMTYEHE